MHRLQFVRLEFPTKSVVLWSCVDSDQSITTGTEIPFGLILCVLEVFDHRRNLGTDSELEMLWWYRRRVATMDGGGIACASSGSRRDPLVAKLARMTGQGTGSGPG